MRIVRAHDAITASRFPEGAGDLASRALSADDLDWRWQQLQAEAVLRLRSLSGNLAKWRRNAVAPVAVARRVNRSPRQSRWHQRRRARAASRALNRWWLFCERRREQAKITASQIALTQKVRCFKRWQRLVRRSSPASGPFMAWFAETRRSARQRHALRRCFDVEASLLLAALGGWRAGASRQRALRARAEELRSLSRAKRQQRAVAAWARAQKVRLLHVAAVALSGQFLQAEVLAAWRLAAEEAEHAAQCGWAQRAQRRAVSRWWAASLGSRPLRGRVCPMLHALARASQLAQRRSLRRAVRLWRRFGERRCLWQALRAWRACAGVQARLRELDLGLGAARQARTARHSFELWRCFWEARLGCLATVVFKEELSTSSLQLRALRAWRLLARKKQRASCAGALVAAQGLRRLLCRWRRALGQQQQLAELLCRRMTRLLRLALLGWSLRTADQLLLRKRASALGRALASSAASSALRRLHDRARRRQAVRLAAEYLAERSCRGTLWEVFGAWSGRLLTSARCARVLSARSAQLLRRRAWEGWRWWRRRWQDLQQRSRRVQLRRAGRLCGAWRRLFAAESRRWPRLFAASSALRRGLGAAAPAAAPESHPAGARTFHRHQLVSSLLSAWQNVASQRERRVSTAQKRAVAELCRATQRLRVLRLWREARWAEAALRAYRRSGGGRLPGAFFLAWRRQAEKRRQETTATEEARRLLLRGRLAAPLGHWHRAFCGRRRLAELRRGGLSQVFRSWLFEVKAARQLTALLAHRAVLEDDRMLRRCVAEWHREGRNGAALRLVRGKRGALWKAVLLEGWRCLVKTRRLARHALVQLRSWASARRKSRGASGLAGRSWRRPLLQAVWNSFRQYLQLHQVAKDRRLQAASCRQILLLWAAHCRESRALGALGASAWRRWRRCAQERAAARRAAEKRLRPHTQRRADPSARAWQKAVWRAWAEVATRRASMSCERRLVRAQNDARMLKKSLRSWWRISSQSAEAKRRARGQARSLLRACCSSWRSAIEFELVSRRRHAGARRLAELLARPRSRKERWLARAEQDDALRAMFVHFTETARPGVHMRGRADDAFQRVLLLLWDRRQLTAAWQRLRGRPGSWRADSGPLTAGPGDAAFAAVEARLPRMAQLMESSRGADQAADGLRGFGPAALWGMLADLLVVGRPKFRG
ncbi:unnamed protein product [Effrenium voratum]|nr:unnamed protein product [Effrenium voratum]